MTVFRWIIGTLGGLLAVATLFSFAIGVAFDNAVWHARARSMRGVLWLTALLWFNVEVWGRIVMALIRWR